MTHAVAIDQFEGPLGLLLELVERNQMPVTSIAVATITAEYLQRIATLDGLSPDDLAEFLQLGSRLVYIKSLALLPGVEPGEEQAELRQLGQELAEYQRYQAAARHLAEHAKHPTWSRQVTSSLAPADIPLPSISLPDLAAAFQAVLARLEPAKPSGAIARQFSQADSLAALKTRLASGSFALHDLLGTLHDRLEVVVTFSALLELIKSGASRVTQTGQFAPIMVEPAGD